MKRRRTDDNEAKIEGVTDFSSTCSKFGDSLKLIKPATCRHSHVSLWRAAETATSKYARGGL